MAVCMNDIQYHNVSSLSPAVAETAIAAASSIAESLALLKEGWTVDEIMVLSHQSSLAPMKSEERLDLQASASIVGELSHDSTARTFLVGSLETVFGLQEADLLDAAAAPTPASAPTRAQAAGHQARDVQVPSYNRG